ncbi:MAG: hypothetical protein GXP62_04425 [Oligoflexia bacterium]|nr:hypothetical protein [Oligoflexia bacterium]
MLLLLLSLAAHAGIFVSADQAAQLAQAGAVVVDARGTGDWNKGHVPGSAPLSWLSLRDGLLRVGRLTDDTGKLQAAIRAAGVRGGAPVVVYDAGRDGWGEAGRIWWMLDYLGHSGVHMEAGPPGRAPAWTRAPTASSRRLATSSLAPMNSDALASPKWKVPWRAARPDPATPCSGTPASNASTTGPRPTASTAAATSPAPPTSGSRT